MTGRSYSFGTLLMIGHLLFLGGVGQAVCYAELFPPSARRGPADLFFCVLVGVPCMMVLGLTGLKGGWPFGPGSFRRGLLFVMGWYASLTLFVEAASVIRHFYPMSGRQPPLGVRLMMRGMMDAGLLSFIPYIRECIFLRQLESKMPPNP